MSDEFDELRPLIVRLARRENDIKAQLEVDKAELARCKKDIKKAHAVWKKYEKKAGHKVGLPSFEDAS